MSPKIEHPCSVGDETVKRAPQVCSHCKSIKKGCDKKLPTCSQCVKRRAICRYGEPDTVRRNELSQQRAGVDDNATCSSWTSLPRAVLSTLSPNVRVSVLMMDSLADVFPSGISDGSKPVPPRSPNDIFHSQINRIITAGSSLDEITSKYFQGVHRWLPIISKKLFRDQIHVSQTSPTADFSILLLCMRLITEYPSDSLDVDQDNDVLYLATKTLFTQLRSFIPCSIYLIQAGIIIATYEHAHGMIEPAYDTVGTCARMAFSTGLHQVRCSDAVQGTSSWYTDEEALSTWWGLLICDRAIGCEPAIQGRPLATRCIREDDYLPLESGDLDDLNQDKPEPIFRYFVAAISLPGVGTFGREAQAAYLLDKALFAVGSNKEVSDAKWVQIYELDQLIQPFLSTIMEQVGGRWGYYCGANALAMNALFILHRRVLGKGIQGPYAEISLIALNTLTRMVIDIAYSFNNESDGFDIDMFSPAISHIVKSAQQHISTGGELRTTLWEKDFEQLKNMLLFLNRRWNIAGKELQTLNRAASWGSCSTEDKALST